MNLDLIAGALCGVVALGAFYLHAASSPGRAAWITLPQSMRWGLGAVGVTWVLRSTDFFSIADQKIPLGHINLLGLSSAAAMTYLVAASVWCVWRGRMKDHQWERLQEVEQAMRADPDTTPAAIHQEQAVSVLKALGANVNAETSES